MPAQTGQSSLAAALGKQLAEAHKEHKDAEVKYQGGGDIPPIEAGVARITKCYFKRYEKGDNEGKYFFFAQAVILEPKEVKDRNGVTTKTEGLFTQISEPLCETPTYTRKTVSDHLGWIYNEFLKLGIDVKNAGLPANIEAVAAAIAKAAQFIRFRVWIGDATDEYPNPRPNHDWRGICDYEPGAASGNGQTATETPDVVDDTGGGEETPDDSAPADLGALAIAADPPNNDEDAQLKIIAEAESAGVDHNAFATWVDVAAEIKSKKGSGEETSTTTTATTTEAEDPDWAPEKEEVYYFKPPKARKAIEGEITMVFANKKTVNIKSLDDPDKLYKNIKWDRLMAEAPE